MRSMSKMAVIGDKDSVLAFKALGIDVFTPIEKEEARKTINYLAKMDYGIIFITEEMASKVRDTISRYDHQFTPVVIPIPSNQGTLYIGLNRIHENVERAAGINLFERGDQT